ncbi:unnamed protein product [Prunus brigantina]
MQMPSSYQRLLNAEAKHQVKVVKNLVRKIELKLKLTPRL